MTISLVYGAITASAQQLGSDQICSASYPCAKICGDHICAPGEMSNEPAQTNQTMNQNATMSTVPQQFKLSTKGQINNSSGIAPGTVVWTVLNGNDGTFIFHGVNGLEVIRLTTTPDPICNSAQAQICLDTSVTQTKDPDQITTIGAKAKINIHPIENQETVGFLSGPFQNIVLQIDLSKIWTYKGSSTTPNPTHMSTLMNTTSMQTNSTSMHPTNSTMQSTNGTSTNSTSVHGTSINPKSTNGTSMNVTNSTYK